MKRFFYFLAFILLSSQLCGAQSKPAVVSVSDIINIVTYRFITEKNEAEDAQAVIDNYTKILKRYGYTNGLIGDGFGGPCSIIDGFYKGGYGSRKTFKFVPTNRKTASMIYMSACNDGEGDYGYLYFTLHVYSKSLARAVTKDIINSGFKKFEFDNPAEAQGTLYYNGNKQVLAGREEGAYTFTFSIAE